jgi:YD repeat-containing protein
MRQTQTQMIVFAITLALASAANAQSSTWHDRGNVIGKIVPQQHGARFYDRAGNVTGSSRVDSAGGVTYYDRSGRVTAKAAPAR